MPQIYFENIKRNCNADIYFWNIVENCDELSELIADTGMLLSEAKKRFTSNARQRDWLATRALLRQTPHNGKEILYHANGQPYIADKHISISHTKDYAAIAVFDTPVGIDIEKIDRKAQTVIKAILQPHEKVEIPEEALDIWTAKEAAFKMSPQKVSVLKDIFAEKNACGYNITYPDGSTATYSIM